MKTNYSRRDAIAVGALALIGTTLNRPHEGGDVDADARRRSQVGAELAIKTRTASCNCGQLRVTTQRPRPGAEVHLPLPLLPEDDGQRILHPSDVPKGAGEDRRQVDGVQVSHRWQAGHVSQLLPHRRHDSFLPHVRFDRLLRAGRDTGEHRGQSRHLHRPDISAAHDFRLRGVPISLGAERRGPSDAGRASQLVEAGPFTQTT